MQREESTVGRIEPTQGNGLKKSSPIRVSKIATIDKDLAKGLLGRLDSNGLSDLNDNLKTLLRLP